MIKSSTFLRLVSSVVAFRGGIPTSYYDYLPEAAVILNEDSVVKSTASDSADKNQPSMITASTNVTKVKHCLDGFEYNKEPITINSPVDISDMIRAGNTTDYVEYAAERAMTAVAYWQDAAALVATTTY